MPSPPLPSFILFLKSKVAIIAATSQNTPDITWSTLVTGLYIPPATTTVMTIAQNIADTQ